MNSRTHWIPARTECAYLWSYLRSFRLRLSGCVALSLMQSICLLPIAWLIKRAFDVVIPRHETGGLVLLGLEILVFNFVASSLTLANRFESLRTTKLAIASVRRDLVTQCQALPSARHQTTSQGELHTVLVQDTHLLDVMLNALVSQLLPSIIMCGALFVLMAVINFRLLLFLSLVLPVLYLLNRQLGNRVKTRVALNRNAFMRFSSGVQFLLRKIELTRYQSAEEFEQHRQHQNVESLRVKSEKMAWIQAAYAQAHNGAVLLVGIIILVVGGLDVAAGRLSLGGLMSFYFATLLFNSSMQQFFSATPQVIEGVQALSALSAFSSENADAFYDGTQQLSFEGGIELRSVNFAYGTQQILDHFSFALEPGSNTAIVGPNGGGKTTLARLILGLYRPQGGHIFADGVPYQLLDIKSLRRFIAFTPQDPVVFAGTIWENLSYGLSEVDTTEMLEVCKIAMVDEFVQQLPMGYETPLDEDGSMISGGQRQKLAIARALARKPSLLILDEPTNHLDEKSIHRLVDALGSIANRPAILVITQNSDFAKSFSRCYQLNQGSLTPLYSEPPVARGAEAEVLR